MKPTYTPRVDSLPAQVIGFFTNNPDEELNLEDISDKFSTTRGNIHTNLALALEAGMLKRERNQDGEYIYKRGPNCPKPRGVDMDAVHKRPGAKTKAAADPDAAPVVLPSIDDVLIESDVPVPAGKGNRIKQDWTPLLSKCRKNDSFKLPLAAKHTLSQNITALHKAGPAKFTVRTFPDTKELRVWRVA